MKKITNQTITKLFSFTRQTWAKWKDENRQITKLLQLYFSDEELNEFLETGKIRKFELIKNLTTKELEKKLNNYNIFDISILKLKLISLPNAAKQLMIEQLNYCIVEKKDYTLEIVKNYHKTHFEKIKEDIWLFIKEPSSILKANPDYFKKDRIKFIYYFENIITKDELLYINQNKEEIIKILETFKGLFAYSTW